jgi:hypothetical protein
MIHRLSYRARAPPMRFVEMQFLAFSDNALQAADNASR